MRRNRIATVALVLLAASLAGAQPLSTPPSGDNQKSSVTQHVGLVKVTIDYSSPDVHAPNGADRRGKIWGELVPWGMTNLGFGTCGDQCPWRAGANENTVFTVSHDVRIQDQPLPAGRYGLHMIPAKDADWTLIFSKNSTSWGSYTYDPAEDALRVAVKPRANDYHEWLTYEFTDRQPDRATVALMWEDLAIPFTISVPNITDLHLAKIREELRHYTGFNWQNWNQAAQYALQAKRPQDAVGFARQAVGFAGIGQENFNTLTTLAMALDAAGEKAEAKATMDRALMHPTATPVDIHQYGRRLQAQGKNTEALEVWKLNAKRHPNVWPVNVGLARGYSATGNYKEALKYAKLALAQAPDDGNRKSLADAVKKLEAGQDMN